MNNTTTVSRHSPRPTFSSGRISALVNAGLLPESVLERTNAETAVVDYCAHDRGRRNDGCRDEDRRETR